MTEPDQPAAGATGDKTYHLSGDFRGAIVNIESTFVGAAAAHDVEGRPPAPGDPPYKGLQSFDEADAEHFLGRERLTARLVGRLRDSRFLAVVGASGSGKSSVVRAGLIPALRGGQPLADGGLPPTGASRWAIRLLTPTAHPLDALAVALVGPDAPPDAAAALAAQLAAGPGALAAAARALLAAEDRPRLLLVIDQFEEAFTLARDAAERKALFDNLVAALDPAADHPISVVVALRADFYARFAEHDGLRDLIAQQQEYIGAMSREELFRAIVAPAARGDWKLQEGLVELMLDDAGDEPGALPLLSHALLETWRRRRGRTMTLSAYAESGGVRGAIAKTAETIFQQRLTPEQRPIARAIFVRLTELGESADDGVPDTRRRAPFSELITRATDPQMLDAVLRILVDARLIITGLVPPTNTQVVEVAHEALIREWPTLRAWLDQDREGLIRHRQLTQDTNDWLKLGRDPGALYRGARLARALAWTAAPPDPLSLTEVEFLDASRAAAAREARAQTTQRALVIGSAVLLVVAVLAALLAFDVISLGRPEPDRMAGRFNIAVAEFAVLDESGQLVESDGGLRVTQELGTALQRAFGVSKLAAAEIPMAGGEPPAVEVWFDGPQLAADHHVTIGVVAPPPLAATEPAAAAETLNADIVIYGDIRPDGDFNALTVRFYVAPQYEADFGAMVGLYEFTRRIPVFDANDPSEEVWDDLEQLVSALAWTIQGMRQEILGDQAEALAAFEEAVTQLPDADMLHYLLGQEHLYSAQRAGSDEAQLAAAEAAFNESLRLNPDNPRAGIGLGSVRFLRGQRLLNEAEARGEGSDPAALEAVRAEAQAALDAYTSVALRGEQSEVYGVPVAGIARVGRAIALRLLAEAAFQGGDLAAAEGFIDQAIATLEDDAAALDTANDPRLPAQAYQALGSVYEWKAFLLGERGAAGEAQAARDTALGYYNDCVRQGEEFPFDTYLVERIVGRLCAPRVAALTVVEGGG
jgi:tetratricopeptide (TPR) repeat protein